MALEHIHYEDEHSDAWVCLCGNMPHADGFYPCRADGTEVEPIEQEHGWDGWLYVCSACGRIIHQGTLEVVGKIEK